MTFRPRGIVPAMVTPVDEQARLNLPQARALARHLVAAGVHGIFVNGSQGEWYAFRDEEKAALVEAVMAEVGSQTTVYAGVAGFTTEEAVRGARAAEEAGAHALSVLTPVFINPSEDELYEHFAAVARATRLPLLPYNNPNRTNVHIRPSLMRRLAEIDNVVGMKDSSGDFLATAEFIRLAPPGFGVLVGHDALILAAMVHGAAGAISSTANVVPELVVRLYGAAAAGDLETARALQHRLSPLRAAFTLGTFPAIIKEALTMIGHPVGPTRAPVGPLTPANRERLRSVLEELGLFNGQYAREALRA